MNKIYFLSFTLLIVLNSCGPSKYLKRREKETPERQMKEMVSVLKQISDKELEEILLREAQNVADLSKTISAEDDFYHRGSTSIDKAKIVFLGETHYEYPCILSNLAILNRYMTLEGGGDGKKNDILLTEGSSSFGSATVYLDPYYLISKLITAYFCKIHNWRYYLENAPFFAYEIKKRLKSIFGGFPQENGNNSKLFQKIKSKGFRLMENIWKMGWDLDLSEDYSKMSEEEVLKSLESRNQSLVENLDRCLESLIEVFSLKDLRQIFYASHATYNKIFIMAGTSHLPLGEYNESKFSGTIDEFYKSGISNSTYMIYEFLKDKLFYEFYY